MNIYLNTLRVEKSVYVTVSMSLYACYRMYTVKNVPTSDSEEVPLLALSIEFIFLPCWAAASCAWAGVVL